MTVCDPYRDGLLFQYLGGVEEAPFRQKRGSLKTSELFDFGDENADNEVSLTEKNNEFKITFGLYDPYGDWHKSSGFKFECFSSTFEPTDYPTQLCGKFTSVQDGICATAKAHNYALHLVSERFSQRCF